MNFNPDPVKPPQEVIINWKIKKYLILQYPPFPSIIIQKTLGYYILDEHLYLTSVIFDEHLKMIFSKNTKTTVLFQKLKHLLTRSTLITIYNAFVSPHLDYGDILYDPVCMSFHKKTGYHSA